MPRFNTTQFISLICLVSSIGSAFVAAAVIIQRNPSLGRSDVIALVLFATGAVVIVSQLRHRGGATAAVLLTMGLFGLVMVTALSLGDLLAVGAGEPERLYYGVGAVGLLLAGLLGFLRSGRSV